MPVKRERILAHNAFVMQRVGCRGGCLRDRYGLVDYDEPAAFKPPPDLIYELMRKVVDFEKNATLLPRLTQCNLRTEVMHEQRRRGVVAVLLARLRRMDIRSRVVLQHDSQTNSYDGVPDIDTYALALVQHRRGQRIDADLVDSKYLKKVQRRDRTDDGLYRGRVIKEVFSKQFFEDLRFGMKLWLEQKRLKREAEEAKREPSPPTDPTPADKAAAVDTGRARREAIAQSRHILDRYTPPPDDDPPITD